jgi:hypothetical protein
MVVMAIANCLANGDVVVLAVSLNTEQGSFEW